MQEIIINVLYDIFNAFYVFGLIFSIILMVFSAIVGSFDKKTWMNPQSKLYICSPRIYQKRVKIKNQRNPFEARINLQDKDHMFHFNWEDNLCYFRFVKWRFTLTTKYAAYFGVIEYKRGIIDNEIVFTVHISWNEILFAVGLLLFSALTFVFLFVYIPVIILSYFGMISNIKKFQKKMLKEFENV